MDDNSESSPKPTTKRLTKSKPQNSAANNVRMSQNIVTQLRRHPSAPQSPANPTNGDLSRDPCDSQRYPFSQNSSSSLEASPSASSKYSAQSPPEPYTGRYRYSGRQSFDDKSPDELNSAASDPTGGLSRIDSTKASGLQNSLRRPGPPQSLKSTSNASIMSPSLRQSASFSIGDRSGGVTPTRVDSGLTTSSKRYSDEASGKSTASGKKRNALSTLMDKFVGTQKGIKISQPENPVHVTHVGFDNETGQFTVSFHRPWKCVVL